MCVTVPGGDFGLFEEEYINNQLMNCRAIKLSELIAKAINIIIKNFKNIANTKLFI